MARLFALSSRKKRDNSRVSSNLLLEISPHGVFFFSSFLFSFLYLLNDFTKKCITARIRDRSLASHPFSSRCTQNISNISLKLGASTAKRLAHFLRDLLAKSVTKKRLSLKQVLGNFAFTYMHLYDFQYQ